MYPIPDFTISRKIFQNHRERNNLFNEFHFAKREKRKWKQEDKNFENICSNIYIF